MKNFRNRFCRLSGPATLVYRLDQLGVQLLILFFGSGISCFIASPPDIFNIFLFAALGRLIVI